MRGRSWTLVLVLVMVVVAGLGVAKDWILEGLKGEAEVLSLATGS